MRRQTDLSLEELKKLIKNGSADTCIKPMGRGSLPIGMLLNEIGVMFITGEDPNAEKELVSLLKNDDIQGAKLVSYCALTTGLERAHKETKEALDLFKKNPENEDLIKKAKKMLAAS